MLLAPLPLLSLIAEVLSEEISRLDHRDSCIVATEVSCLVVSKCILAQSLEARGALVSGYVLKQSLHEATVVKCFDIGCTLDIGLSVGLQKRPHEE